MICPNCKQEIGDEICEFCNVKINTTDFLSLCRRFHKNSSWLKDQKQLCPEVEYQFNSEIVDPLHIEQDNLLKSGITSAEIITLFESQTN